ncbi:MAG TPA: type II secretion system protein [Phycisphaerales bacterium]|nr:type II secretion system protein [Phycisphaerales bacterium]
MMITGSTIPAIGRRAAARGARRGFTVIEMLVAVSIIIIVTALVIPAIGSLMRSANFSAAVNTVSAALANARALAVQNGRETGVAFLFDVRTQVTTVVVLELDQNRATLASEGRPGEHTYCAAMHPATGEVPIELPPGIGVYGLPSVPVRPRLASGLANPEWTQGINRAIGGVPETAHWYTGNVVRPLTTGGAEPEENTWVLPFNDGRLFTEAPESGDSDYDSTVRPDDRIGRNPWEAIRGGGAAATSAQLAVRHANSFCIVFGATGGIVTAPIVGGAPCLNMYIEWTSAPIDPQATGADPEPYDEPAVFDPEVRSTSGPSHYAPNPEVVLRSVSQLAIVDMVALASETGVRRPWAVRAVNTGITGPRVRAPIPAWVTESDEQIRKISRWVELNGELLTFNRYSGSVVRRGAQ